MKKVISICGSDLDDSELSNYALEVAEQVGSLIAKKGGVLLCGGHGGVMRAACRGAKEENGITVGIMPFTKEEANEFIDISIPTTMGYVRNYIVANAGDIVIAIGGRWGTLNEISYRMICEKPLILIRGTGGCVDEIISGRLMQDVESHYFVVNSAEEAVEKAFEFL
jgi:uncharacterized protein (TIGR00725 family)